MANKDVKSFGFGIRALKNHPETIPLVTIVGIAAVGLVSFCIYSLLSKNDIIYNKRGVPKWETIDPEKPQKLLTVNQEWKKIPELEELRKELGPYKPR